jgi:hypothetical protein
VTLIIITITLLKDEPIDRRVEAPLGGLRHEALACVVVAMSVQRKDKQSFNNYKY